MDDIFYGSTKVKKEYIKKWVESKSEFKNKQKISNILYIIALAIWGVCIAIPAILLIGNDTILSGIIAGIAVGAIAAAIPFSIGSTIRRRAFQESGAPFVRMGRDCIRIYEDGIEYLYHNTSSDYDESMDVYRIPAEKINAVNYDQKYHMVTIIGEGELLAYDDYAAKRLNYQKSQRKFYSNSPYSFIASFDEENQIVQRLKGMAKNQ